jgi:TM2 domain-containing membrane protein YozV
VTTSATTPKKEMKTGKGMLITTIFLGWLGVHRFASGQIGMGFLYLFTGGLFLIGWIHDIVVQVKALNQ